jgi:hypothetical protein
MPSTPVRTWSLGRLAAVVAICVVLVGSQSCATRVPEAWTVLARASEVRRFERFELTLKPAQGGELPAGATVMATFSGPSGQHSKVRGFREGAALTIRFAPRELGRHEYAVTVRRNRKDVTVGRGEFVSVAGESRGFVHVSTTNPHYLAHDDGSQVLLIGENRFNVYDPTWNYDGLDMEPYIAAMAGYGENALRIFIFTDCEDESRPTRRQPGCLEPQVGHFDEAVARTYDRLFEAAERHGVYVILTLFAVGFTPGDVWKGWEDNPYSRARGGPAATPLDFFTDPAVRKAATGRLEYVLARYGSSPALLAVDLVNEPEWDGEIGEQTWIAWARELARVWRESDPYGHLVTAGPVGLHWNIEGDERPWYAAAENDLVQWHLYGPEIYQVHALASEITRKVQETWGYQKPVVLGEFAYGGEPKPAYDHTHVGTWTATFSGAGVLAHSAPPFTEDSDEPMTPERGAHLRVLRNFLATLGTVQGPIAREKIQALPSSIWVWGLSASDATALWLLAPEAEYTQPVAAAQVVLDDVPCAELDAEAWDDVSGQLLSVAPVTVTSTSLPGAPQHCRAQLAVPEFTRHIAMRIRARGGAPADGARRP